MKNLLDKKIKDAVNLYFIGDTHYGNAGCVRTKFLETLNQIKKDPDAAVIFMGDCVDAINQTEKRANPEEIAHNIMSHEKFINLISEQWKMFEEDISMIKDKIWGIHSGNHGDKFMRNTCVNELRRICERLNVEYLDSGLAHWHVHNHKGEIFIETGHGTGGGLTAGYVYSNIEKRSNYFKDMDIVARGHTHKLGVNLSVASMSFNDDGEPVGKSQYHCATGSFLRNYVPGITGYAERSEYPPLPIGYVRATIIDGKITEVKPVPL